MLSMRLSKVRGEGVVGEGRRYVVVVVVVVMARAGTADQMWQSSGTSLLRKLEDESSVIVVCPLLKTICKLDLY